MNRFFARRPSRSTPLCKRRRKWGAEVLEPRLVLDSTVVFSEVMYNPAGMDEALEWVELHNQMAVDIDISGWRLDDGVQYTFPPGTIMPGGAYLVIANSPDVLAQATGFADALGPFDGNLGNGGDRLELRTHTDRLINEVTYDDAGDWPVAADGSGASLAKRSSQAASHLAENWTVSAQLGGTPGRLNFSEGDTIQQTTIVPMDTTWRYEQSGTDQGTAWKEPGFDDSTWPAGAALLYVESDSLPAAKRTPLTLGERTYYFRTTFQFDGDTTDAALRLNHIVDDGAVFYLNGQEVTRFNMPGGTITANTLANGAVGNAAETLSASFDVSLLQPGENTLAVEVHQIADTSSDVVFGTELLLERVIPADTTADAVFTLSEVSAWDADPFWVEIHNRDDQPHDLAGYILETSGQTPGQVTLGSLMVPAGGYVTIDATVLGTTPDAGERVFLYRPTRTRVVDAALIESFAQARSPAWDNRWQIPSLTTPGAANQFETADDIVINEVMYQARPTYATDAVSEPSSVLPLDAEWRFDDSGTDRGTAWREPGYDDSAWSSGDGLFFIETASLPGPKNTPLTFGRPTYYFRNTFELTGAPDDTPLSLRHVVDDGAVFYINGVEFARFNMPDGDITYDTLANIAVGDGVLVGPLTIPSNLLVTGTNTIAVETHQIFAFSPDVVFGAEITSSSITVPATEFAESDEEWIELYNRGTSSVELSGWRLNDAVDFTFPANTFLGPGEYAVVSRNAATFQARHPGVALLGEYSGVLSDGDERIQLLDARGNLADEIHYFDGGRWPEFADGGGTSLELKSPFADNSVPEAWADSDEAGRSEWQHVSYTMTVDPIVHDPPINFHEFVMGLLSAGEVWVDNVSVIENPAGGGPELIQNGSFEADAVGSAASKWRIQGTHGQSRVIADPDNPGNNVLQLVADARINYLSNHAETTLANGARVVDGRTYEISFDAKWIKGSPQLHTELYYKDAARTTILNQPVAAGTPGAANSAYINNLGPTYQDVGHTPVVPSSGDSVTVHATPSDSDGIATMTLFYRLDGSGTFTAVSMTPQANGSYAGMIPPQANNRVVQFYVEGRDARGATTTFPAQGAESRALYKVVNGYTPDARRHDFQIVTTPADASAMHVATNMMNNDRKGATVIYDGTEVYYDVGVRLRGSMFTRQSVSATGYNVRFNADQPFRGVHETVAFDQNGEQEILAKFLTTQSGHLGGTYDDIMQLSTPTGSGGGPTLAYLARHDDVFLEEQFENGDEGTLFKFEGIRVMTSTVDGTPEGLKIYQPIGWVPQFDIQDLGDSKELYRWPFLINRQRDRDDYSQMIAMAKAFSLTGDALNERVAEVMDVDNLTQTFALMSLLGIGDVYSQGNPHNLNFYVRPSDGKMLAFPWDWDFTFNQSTTAPLHGNKNIGKILDLPHYEHFLLGHMEHLIQTVFNREYMSHWTEHFGSLLGASYNGYLNNIDGRGSFVLSQLPAETPFDVGSEPPVVNATTLVAEDAPAVALIPSTANGGSSLGTSWTTVDFIPSAAWLGGSTGVGYETSPADYDSLINLDVGAMFNTTPSVFVRVPFDVSLDTADVDNLVLRMKYDDGFVAYLNGVEVASANAPGSIAWNSLATTNHDDAAATTFVDFDISAFRHLLVPGQNVLAIQGLNQSPQSSDLLILPELIAEQIDEGTTEDIEVDTPVVTLGGQGWVNVKEIRLAGQNDPLPVQWLSPTTWEVTLPLQPGLNPLTFTAYDFGGNVLGTDYLNVTSTLPRPTIEHLRVSEIMYHPAAPTSAELAAGFTEDDFEFIELFNASTGGEAVTLDLTGVRLVDGIEFTADGGTLASGEYAVIVQNTAAFRMRYGTTARVLGEFAAGRLSNAGENLALQDAAGTTFLEVEYGDSGLWPERADGFGASLELRDASIDLAAMNKHYAWRGSARWNGSPGSAGDAAPGVVVNEVFTNSDDAAGQLDAIELYNSADASVDIGGWYLSDDPEQLLKYQIPAGTFLAAGDFIVFDERDFNPTPADPAPRDFALNGTDGESVWLTTVDPLGNTEWFVDEVHFGGSFDQQSLGRVTTGSSRFANLARPTLGCVNRYPHTAPIVISELQYSPSEPTAAALALAPDLEPADLEYVELANISVSDIDLHGWQLRGGIDFDVTETTLVAPNAVVVVISFNPEDPLNADRLAGFRAHYGLDMSAVILGGYGGQLSNNGEALRLEQPIGPVPGDPLDASHVAVDMVVYDNLPPWPTDTDGNGNSLQRRGATLHGDTPAAWTSSPGSPGALVLTPAIPGDFDGDGSRTAADIDILWDAVARASTVATFDGNGDQRVDSQDITFWLESLVGTRAGDANLDGSVDAADFGIWSSHRFTRCGTWSRGDLNGDLVVDGSDFLIWNAHKFTAAPAASASATGAPALQRTPRAPLHQQTVPVPQAVAMPGQTKQRVPTATDDVAQNVFTSPHDASQAAASTRQRPLVRRNMVTSAERRREALSRQYIAGHVSPELVDTVLSRDDWFPGLSLPDAPSP